MTGENGDSPVSERSARELVQRCLDGAATEAETAELDGLIVRDPAVARELARAALLESSLEVVSRGAAKNADPLRVFPERRPLFQRRRSVLLLLAAALTLSSIGLALVATRPWVREPSPNDAATSSRPTSAAPKAPLPERAAVGEPAPEPAAPMDDHRPLSAAPTNAGRTNEAESPSARAAQAADSLQAANQLRRQGRWADSERAYAQIATSYAGTAQGSVAALAAASLRLEHLGNPRGALQLYQSVRSPALSAEAELGIANSYRALGDRPGEIAALNRFVQTHPNALSRERAQKRLEALQSGKP